MDELQRFVDHVLEEMYLIFVRWKNYSMLDSYENLFDLQKLENFDSRPF